MKMPGLIAPPFRAGANWGCPTFNPRPEGRGNKKAGAMNSPIELPNVQVSDTTGGDSSTKACYII
jgi:hypothetical protein